MVKCHILFEKFQSSVATGLRQLVCSELWERPDKKNKLILQPYKRICFSVNSSVWGCCLRMLKGESGLIELIRRFAPSDFWHEKQEGVGKYHRNKFEKQWQISAFPTLSEQNCSCPGSTKRPRAGTADGGRLSGSCSGGMAGEWKDYCLEGTIAGKTPKHHNVFSI